MKIAYVIFYSADLPRAVGFYRDVIGLRIVEQLPTFVGFDLNGSLLGIKARAEEREVPGHQTVILGCSNLDQMFDRCVRAKVDVCKPITTEEWGRNFAVLDPDANKVEFVEDSTA